MINLHIKNYYSRKEIHQTWGLHGIIKIPNRDGDYVFIVTYGQSQGDHQFDEGITKEGVLSWQSQPRQNFKSKIIIDLINHNEITNNIYLFLRKEKKGKYEYLGRLKYLNHDNERENPVYFQWQLIDIDNIDKIKKNIDKPDLKNEVKLGNIKLISKLPKSKSLGITKENFRTIKKPDYGLKDSKNRKLGEIGEELVLKFEKNYLKSIGRNDLAKKIVHISKIEGDGAGYDIKSFNEKGETKFIEVKTTRGDINTDFYMSPREILFSKINKKKFFLYRIYNLDKKNNNGEFFVFSGDLDSSFNKTPTNFRLSKK